MDGLSCLGHLLSHHIDSFFQSGQFRLSTIPRKAEIQVELGPVRCELDISIVDRLNSLLQPQKLATAELMASHLYTSYNKHVSLVWTNFLFKMKRM